MISINCPDNLYFLYKNNLLNKVICSPKPVLSTSDKTKGITLECKNGVIQTIKPVQHWMRPGGDIYGIDQKELFESTQTLVNFAKPFCLKGEDSKIEIRKK
jgi:hypothetical protein